MCHAVGHLSSDGGRTPASETASGEWGVIVYARYLRFWHHDTLEQIHQVLAQQHRLPLSRSEVMNLLVDFLSLLRAAQPNRVRRQRERWQQQGGVVIAVDGVQPEKGNECLYLVQEVGRGLTSYAQTLPESSHSRISREVLQAVQQMLTELGVSVWGVVGDGQGSLVMAMEETFPQVPY